MLRNDGIPFRLVIEEPEREAYAAVWGDECLLALPFTGQGISAARTWTKAHARGEGHYRHWQIDDNIRCIRRFLRGKQLKCAPGPALRMVEEFVDRYTNVAAAGLKHQAYISSEPFAMNQQVYSCMLIRSDLPHEWRGLPSDTDFSLQILSSGWCTVLISAFQIEKAGTTSMKGGNTEAYSQDGRLKGLRALQARWPGVVSLTRRNGRVSATVTAWHKYPQRLERKPSTDSEAS